MVFVPNFAVGLTLILPAWCWVNVLLLSDGQPSYRYRFSAGIELKREKVSELFGEVKKDFSEKSGPREFGCVQKCKLSSFIRILVGYHSGSSPDLYFAGTRFIS